MLQIIIQYIKLVFTNYLLIIFIISGAILTFFYAPTISEDRFPIEKKLAKFGGIGYIGFGIGMYILISIIK